jgi:hypothetical protein
MRALALLAALAGCGPGPRQREPDEYLGCATDESWRTFDDRETTGQVKVDDAQAPLFAMPIGPARPTLAWQITPTAPGKPSGDAACMQCPTCGPLIPDHLPPISGDVYDLQFTVDNAVAWRTLTTLQTWTPSDATWSAWKGKSVSLVAVRVGLKVNDVQDGPYKASKPITFSAQ